MSVATETSATDLLRLTQCPKCDYSLEGLPAEGTCPECGYLYDQKSLVLRGLPGNNEATNKASGKKLKWWDFISTITIVAVLLFFFRHSMDPIIFLVACYACVMTLMAFLVQISSPRGFEALLWITPDGVGHQDNFDPTSPIARLRDWVPRILNGAFLFVVVVGLSGTHRIVGGLVAIALTSIAVLSKRFFAQIKVAAPASDVRPAIVAWSAFSRFELRALKDAHYQIRGKCQSWLMRQMPINFQLQCSPSELEQLKKYVRTHASAAKLIGW